MKVRPVHLAAVLAIAVAANLIAGWITRKVVKS